MVTKAGDTARRREAVQRTLDLHADGNSIRDIARVEGITLDQARRRLREGLTSQPLMEVDEVRAGQELRLDRAAKRLEPLLNSDDPRIVVQATNALATVERDRARLLGTNIRPQDHAKDED